jgi:hypothetical protein
MTDYPAALTITPDANTLAAWKEASRGLVKPQQFNKALALAVNRALKAARTEALKQATAQYTVKNTDIKGTASMAYAHAGRPEGEARFTGPRIPLMKFKIDPKTPPPQAGIPVSARQGMKKVQIRKDGGGPVPYLTVINLQGEPAVYRRTGSGKYSLTKETGPSVVSMVGNDTAAAAIMARAQEIMDERLDHEMKWMFSK